jgi:hypothetical protein
MVVCLLRLKALLRSDEPADDVPLNTFFDNALWTPVTIPMDSSGRRSPGTRAYGDSRFGILETMHVKKRATTSIADS